MAIIGAQENLKEEYHSLKNQKLSLIEKGGGTGPVKP
jgi:hypothetical protein